MRPDDRDLALQAVLAVNAAAALAAAVVLALRPEVIPAVVGLRLAPGDALVARLLAAAEFAVAFLSASAFRSRHPEARRQTVGALAVFHIASAAAGLTSVASGAVLVLVNVLVRAIVVGALLLTWRRERSAANPCPRH